MHETFTNIQNIIECVKKQPAFFKKYNLHEYITQEILGLRMRRFQGILKVEILKF